MNEYAVISMDRLKNIFDVEAGLQRDIYFLSQRVRELEILLMEAYQDSDSNYYVHLDKKEVAKILNITEGKTEESETDND